MYNEVFESCLFDNDDNGYCCLVNTSRFDQEREIAKARRIDNDQSSAETTFGKTTKW